jgi:hypothetical protein
VNAVNGQIYLAGVPGADGVDGVDGADGADGVNFRWAAATATYLAAILGKKAISSGLRGRTTLPGEPTTREPGGISVPFVTKV